MIDADRLRSMFLAFFAERGHAIIPSASLIPQGDPPVLFTPPGVPPRLPYLPAPPPIPGGVPRVFLPPGGLLPFLPSLPGRPPPAGRLLADCQKCLRTTDI